MPAASLPVDAILFDFDGVVLDSVRFKQNQFRAIIQERIPDQLEPAMAYYLSHGGTSRVEKFRWIWANLVGRPLPPGEPEALGAEFARRVREGVLACPFVPGADVFLERYHAQIPCYVISGTPQPELRDIVQTRGLDRYFQGVYGSPESKTTIGGRILSEHSYDRSRSWFIGDATTDRDAAKALGIGFVGLDGPHLTPFLDGSEKIVSDLFGLAAALGL
jgi:phosphoglycolate phosphatase-like HAD superfamily hydrolase